MDVENLRSEELGLSWLLDTGSGYDLISKHMVDDYPGYIQKVGKALRFNTAGGRTKTEHEVRMCISEMANILAKPLVMQKSPSVLTVGKRCQDEGFGFYWRPHAEEALFAHPDAQNITNAPAIGHIPVVHPNTTALQTTTTTELVEFAERIGAQFCSYGDSTQLVLPILTHNEHLHEAARQWSNNLVPVTESSGDSMAATHGSAVDISCKSMVFTTNSDQCNQPGMDVLFKDLVYQSGTDFHCEFNGFGINQTDGLDTDRICASEECPIEQPELASSNSSPDSATRQPKRVKKRVRKCKRDLRAEAISIRHQTSHKPFNH